MRGGFALFAGGEDKKVKELAINANTIVSADLFFRRFIFDAVIDFFTYWADRIFLGIARRDPFLATKSSYRFAGYRRFNDLFLLNVMGEAIMAAIIML